MTTPDPDRLSQLEHRVADLESRLAAMASARPAAPAPPPGWGQAAKAARPAAAAATPSVAVSSAAAGAPGAPAAPVAPAVPAARTASRSFADFEEQLSSRLLAWIGGIALVLGAMFFLSLAFSRGWIGPEARVLIGLVAGGAALLAGAWLFDRGNRTPATVLTGVGVGTGSLALFAASRLYGFIPVDVALAAFLVLAIGTAAIALRANAQAVAAFGIVATIGAPPLLGASPTLVTLGFLGAALIGSALISFRRSWPWLALLAFLLSAPQAARWFLDEPSIGVAIVGVAAFWTVNALAASGAALAGVQRGVHRASATLLASNALVAIWAIHTVLPDPFARSLGLIILAGLHGALGLGLLLRSPDRHPLGALAAGLAAGTLAIGIAIELGGIAVPIGHTVLATAVAWVAIRFRDRLAALVAAAIGSLAILHVLFIDYPLRPPFIAAPADWPFTSPEAIVVFVIAAGLMVTGLMAWSSFSAKPFRDPRWTPGVALAGGYLGGLLVVAYAAQFELRPDLRVAAWALLAIASFGFAVFVHRDRLAWQLAALTGAGLIVFGASAALFVVAPPSRLHVDPERSNAVVPLLNSETFAVAALIAALAVAGWVVARWSPTRPFTRSNDPLAVGAFAGASVLVVYLLSIAIVDAFQARIGSGVATDELATQAQVALSIAWVLVGATVFAAGLVRRVPAARAFGLGLLALATAKVFLFDLASLDVSYRVLSFLGLGGVLLASSFVAARFRAPATTSTE